jgi:hypothetical protein
MACEPVASNWPTVHSQDDKKVNIYIYIYIYTHTHTHTHTHILAGMILTGGYKIIGKTCTSTIGPTKLPRGMAWN